MSKQSSVEWLQKAIYDKLHMNSNKTYEYIINKAKAMHQEEIEEAYGHGQNNGYMYAHQKAITISKENYFNQTFGDEKEML